MLAKGYEVHGVIRRASTFNTSRLDHLYVDPHEVGAKLVLHHGDLSDGSRLVTLLAGIAPDEVYNLAAQSHVRISFDEPVHTADITGSGAMRMLEAVRLAGVDCPFYQASSSEMFGASPPQHEATPFHPRSPYGAAKVYCYWATRNHREAYGMFAVNGILFNHESPRRGETFVTRKITRAVARIKAGIQSELFLGNLDAVRDWGYAPEYVEGMWRMLQTPNPPTTCWRPAAVARCATSSRRRSTTPDWIGGPTSATTNATYAPPRWSPWWVTHGPPNANSVHAPELVRIMVDADIAALAAGS